MGVMAAHSKQEICYDKNHPTEMKGVYTVTGEVWGAGPSRRRHGRGVTVHCEGDRYEGEFREEATSGRGVYTHNDGRHYDAEWRSDPLSGKRLHLAAATRASLAATTSYRSAYGRLI